MASITQELFRATVLAVVFVGTALWEQARPEWNTTVPAGPRWFANIALYALCAGAAMLLIPLRTLAQSFTPQIALFPAFPETGIAGLVHFVTMIFALDLSYYLGHRALHKSASLWRIHAVHHTDLDLDVTTNLRHHPVEVLLFTAVVLGVGVLFGATSDEMIGYGVLAFAVQLLAHANVALPSWLNSTIGKLFVTPAFHRIHHSLDESECHANFGEVFVLWDVLFGTAIKPKMQKPAEFGVRRYLGPRYQTLRLMLLHPVLRQL